MRKLIAVALLAFGVARAAVTTPTISVSYTCDGSTTAFPVTFPFMTGTDLIVTDTTVSSGLVVTRANGSDYTVVGGSDATGTVTTSGASSPCVTGHTLTITRSTWAAQPVTLSPQGPFRPVTHMAAWDRLTMLHQELAAKEAADFATALNPSPTTVNGASQITPTGATTSRALSAILADTISMIGSLPAGQPDGSTDNTAAMQAALTNAPTGSSVYLPPGTYKVTGSGLSITKSLKVTMAKGAVLSCSASACLTVSNATGVRIEGGTINMLSTGAGQFGVTWSGTVTDATVEGVTITGTGAVSDAQQGIGNNSGPALTNIRLLNNTISNVTIGISVNADLSGSITGALIQGNHITNIVGGNSGQGYGIHHANGSGNPSWVRIVANVIDGAQRHSIYQAKGRGVVIQGNTIRNHRATIAGGDSHGVQRPAISIGRSSGVTVVANVIESPQDCAIDVFPATGFPISNITIESNVIRNWQSFPAITLGTTAPATDGIPTAVLIENNQLLTDASVTGTGLEAIRVYSGKGVSIVGNWLEQDNGTNGQLIDFQGTSEGALTTNYTDDIRVVANHGSMSGTGQRFVRFETNFLNAASRAEFYLNRVTVSGSGASTFNLPTGQTNPNIFAYAQAFDGLNNDAIHPLPLGYDLPLPKYATATYAAGIAADCSVASVWTVTATDATAFGFNSPSNCTKGQVITMTVRNASGGALNAQDPFGVASYKHGTWTQPANGYSRSITFRHDGSSLIEISRTPADVPN